MKTNKQNGSTIAQENIADRLEEAKKKLVVDPTVPQSTDPNVDVVVDQTVVPAGPEASAQSAPSTIEQQVETSAQIAEAGNGGVATLGQPTQTVVAVNRQTPAEANNPVVQAAAMASTEKPLGPFDTQIKEIIDSYHSGNQPGAATQAAVDIVPNGIESGAGATSNAIPAQPAPVANQLPEDIVGGGTEANPVQAEGTVQVAETNPTPTGLVTQPTDVVPAGAMDSLVSFFGGRDAKFITTLEDTANASEQFPALAKAHRNVFFNGETPRTVSEVIRFVQGQGDQVAPKEGDANVPAGSEVAQVAADIAQTDAALLGQATAAAVVQDEQAAQQNASEVAPVTGPDAAIAEQQAVQAENTEVNNLAEGLAQSQAPAPGDTQSNLPEAGPTNMDPVAGGQLAPPNDPPAPDVAAQNEGEQLGTGADAPEIPPPSDATPVEAAAPEQEPVVEPTPTEGEASADAAPPSLDGETDAQTDPLAESGTPDEAAPSGTDGEASAIPEGTGEEATPASDEEGSGDDSATPEENALDAPTIPPAGEDVKEVAGGGDKAPLSDEANPNDAPAPDAEASAEETVEAAAADAAEGDEGATPAEAAQVEPQATDSGESTPEAGVGPEGDPTKEGEEFSAPEASTDTPADVPAEGAESTDVATSLNADPDAGGSTPSSADDASSSTETSELIDEGDPLTDATAAAPDAQPGAPIEPGAEAPAAAEAPETPPPGSDEAEAAIAQTDAIVGTNAEADIPDAVTGDGFGDGPLDADQIDALLNSGRPAEEIVEVMRQKGIQGSEGTPDPVDPNAPAPLGDAVTPPNPENPEGEVPTDSANLNGDPAPTPEDEGEEDVEVSINESNKKLDETSEKADSVDAMIDEAAGVSSRLGEVAEMVADKMDDVEKGDGKGKGMDEKTARLVEIATESLCLSVGFAPHRSKAISMEGFADGEQSNYLTSLALEDLRTNAKRILDNVIAAIMASIRWMAEAFVEMLRQKDLLRRAIVQLRAKAEMAKAPDAQRDIDATAFISKLHIGGKIPADLAASTFAYGYLMKSAIGELASWSKEMGRRLEVATQGKSTGSFDYEPIELKAASIDLTSRELQGYGVYDRAASGAITDEQLGGKVILDVTVKGGPIGSHGADGKQLTSQTAEVFIGDKLGLSLVDRLGDPTLQSKVLALNPNEIVDICDAAIKLLDDVDSVRRASFDMKDSKESLRKAVENVARNTKSIDENVQGASDLQIVKAALRAVDLPTGAMIRHALYIANGLYQYGRTSLLSYDGK